ncbi:MAG TPA: L-serine ammonia-lyase, iron-sulfur-dependent, subunit beta [Candidatus Gallacutalibacter pullistercoris]|nr:L-serine ammonia-lyase, iron-sulfur-dependent, subunit beta [Candidatus Gallacutalibacter pullistercoris]
MNAFDVIGPVMIGPSSSHTAGAVRIGNMAGALLPGKPVRALIGLHGSFAKTGRGHGTEKALTAGIMGMLPSDTRIRNSLELAEKEGISVVFEEVEIDGAHPNTALITLWNEQGDSVSVQGASIGGGEILITCVDGMSVELTGNQPTLLVLHRDVPGVIAGVTNYLAMNGVNIGGFKLSRKKKGDMALMTLELDEAPDERVTNGIRCFPQISRCVLILPAP